MAVGITAGTGAARGTDCTRLCSMSDHVVALHGVAALESPLDAVFRNIYAMIRRLRNVRGRAGNRRKHGVAKRRYASIRSVIRFYRCRDPALSDGKFACASAHFVGDRDTLQTDDLADELREIGERSAEISRVCGGDGVCLLIRCLCVHEYEN